MGGDRRTVLIACLVTANRVAGRARGVDVRPWKDRITRSRSIVHSVKSRPTRAKRTQSPYASRELESPI